jgi:hypothetical protein
MGYEDRSSRSIFEILARKKSEKVGLGDDLYFLWRRGDLHA